MKTASHPDVLRVNPIACTGHGVCAELLPELIELDEWGYPIIDGDQLPPSLERDARKAVAACPALALKLLKPLQDVVAGVRLGGDRT
jgi:ferredoxin